jgi:pilus assembly protein Flp/PilA
MIIPTRLWRAWRLLSSSVYQKGVIMKSLVIGLRRFLVAEEGPTAVEYAVMLALIICVCLAAITMIGTSASSVFSNVSSSL